MFLRGCSRARQLAGELAVAQHDDAVGQLFDFAQPMRDIQDAHAARPQIAHDFEQFLRLVLGKRRRGLVHDEHPGVRAQRFGDFDELLLADRERADDRLRIDVEADHLEILARFAIDRRPVDQAETLRLAAEKNIGADRKIVGQVEFLMDQRNAEP